MGHDKRLLQTRYHQTMLTMSLDLRSIHYEEVLPTLAGNRLKVFSALIEHGPCTAIELAEKMGWDKTSVRPRIVELRKMGRAEETGDRRNKEHVFKAIRAEEQMELSA